MKTDADPKRVQRVLEQYDVLSHFTKKNQPFFLAFFEKGEEINRRLSPSENLLFMVKGTAMIYGVREDGSYTAITDVDAPSVFGDMEFSHPRSHTYQIRLETDAVFAVLPLKDTKEDLCKDPQLLGYLLDSLALKMDMITSTMKEPADLKGRILWLMAYHWNGKLQGTGKAAALLNCSRRQLQRLLVELCQEGAIEKTGRGRYSLLERRDIV
jgi:CRP-like cAMP-binding protein